MIKNFGKFVPEENILTDELMSRHTTFRTGGPASCFIRISTREELSKIIDYLNKCEQNYYVLGNGSNLLVSDKGYEGVILSTTEAFNKVECVGNQIIAQAGALNSRIAACARDNGLTGFEFAAGIPGSIGGAMVMNAGAYGGEMSQVVKTVDIVDKSGEMMTLDNETMEFGYRHSVIKNSKYIVTGVVLELQKGDPETIKNKMNELAAKRREKQPLEYASAGSTFKRPEGYFAGKLIQDAGLCGMSVGDAQVSEKHCGFVINRGNATASQIMELIKKVQETVYQNSGVQLETEVITLGQF
ncbi:MAG: UDP-N-acetylmuramate dehydrogenase [Butyrivibrio sp.]|nr:UDP-N-acetylmuramate dehydrogenase [Butyrivibrio sp.]